MAGPFPLRVLHKEHFDADLRYDKETGILSRIENGVTRPIGTKNSGGYLVFSLRRNMYVAHRVIWKMVTGEDPITIDHINGNRSDNRWCNLRNVTALDNRRNSKLVEKNETGFNGVDITPAGKFAASVGVNRRLIHLGNFETLREAVAARLGADKVLGFHENHGKKRT